MKSHIIGSHEGYDILVDRQRQSFQDVKASAYESAVLLKFVAKRTQKIEILDRATGERVEMLGDGRVASPNNLGTIRQLTPGLEALTRLHFRQITVFD